MPRKILKHFLKKKCQDRQKENLVSNMGSELIEHADENPRQHTCSLMNTTDQSGVILTDILTEDKYFQELKDAADQVKQWEKENGIMHGNMGFGIFTPCKLKHYLTAVERFVDSNFPALPTNSQALTEEYLNDAMSLICSKVIRLDPVLGHSGLVNYLVESYNCHLFEFLRLLMDSSISVRDSFLLLQWVKETYFRQNHCSLPEPLRQNRLLSENNVLSLSDPLLLADWLKFAEKKCLTLLKDVISTTLRNILHHDQSTEICDDSNEEAFICIQIDVIRCLNSYIQKSETVSHTLKNTVQRLCCDELHCFLQKYMNAQKANEGNLLWQFKTIYTCRNLRFYALSIDSNKKTDLDNVLENMENHSLSIAQQLFKSIAKDELKKYFKKEDGHLHNMMTVIRSMLATLPQITQGEETKQLILKAAYQGIVSAYLECLMQRKYKHLEKRWNDVGERIMCDADLFHSTFAEEQNGSDDKQKMVLFLTGEVLQCSQIDVLELLCAKLYKTCQKESKEYIPTLLLWKGTLSRRQIKKVIDVIREVQDNIQKRARVCIPCMYWWCCLF